MAKHKNQRQITQQDIALIVISMTGSSDGLDLPMVEKMAYDDLIDEFSDGELFVRPKGRKQLARVLARAVQQAVTSAL